MKCKLCLQDKSLRNSHIIPSYVFKWLKDTSATGYIRSTGKPNVRMQDGWKEKLLCAECEQLLSKFERQFANGIFYPYVNKELDKNGIATAQIKFFEYKDWLLKFIISTHWRSIVYSNASFKNEKFNDIVLTQCEIWRQFLVSERKDTGSNESYLIFLQNLAYGHGNLPNMISGNVNHYLLRSVDFTKVSSNKAIASYAKLGPIALFTTLKPSQMPKVSDIKIHIKGKIKTAQTLKNTDITNFIFITRPKEVEEYYKVSINQQAKIDSFVRNNPDRLVNSLSIGALKGDYILKNKE